MNQNKMSLSFLSSIIFISSESTSLIPFFCRTSCYLAFSFSSSSISLFLFAKTFFNLKYSSLDNSSNSYSIYACTSKNLGTTTCSKAFTLLFVTFITLSNVKNEVYKPAIFTKFSKQSRNFYRQA